MSTNPILQKKTPQPKTQTLKKAFLATAPVAFGYIPTGIAFSMLLISTGYSPILAILMSIFVYAGSMQFLSVELLATGASFIQIALITFLVNARHIFYGLSLFKIFDKQGKKKPYMIYSLTDETYTLFTSTTVPSDVEEQRYYFYISLFDHCYWVLGTILGAVLGASLTINTTGMDFALTAMFTVMLLEQILSKTPNIIFLISAASGILCIVFLPANMMLLSSILLALALTFAFRKVVVKNAQQ